jgi:hypothetical protein
MTDKFKPPDHWIWDEDNTVYRDETDCDRLGVPAAYTEDGNRLRGFGSPYYRDKYQNKDGRPKGRDTSKLEQAQDTLDAFAPIGIKRLRMIAENKWELLGEKGPVPLKLQQETMRYLTSLSIAAEKEKAKYEAQEKKVEENNTPKDDEDYSIGENVVAFTPE